MSLTKEECEKALDSLRVFSLQNLNANLREVTKSNDVIEQLIKERYENPPLKFEELEEDMVVWDNKKKMFIKIFDIATLEENCFSFEVFGWEVPIYDEQFEENRFYPVQMANVG